MSTTAAADPDRYSLGFAEASDILGADGGTFLGEAVDGSSALVRFTLLGDADLDGAVTAFDLRRLRRNLSRAGAWSVGDFDYDGRVTARDYATLRRNFGLALPAGAFDASTAQVVPEPVLGLAVPSMLLACRRTRRGAAKRARRP